jgi:D-3-phosphoglycerate dehydrogenase
MTKHKLLITDGLGNEGLKILQDSGLFEIDFRKSIETSELSQILPSFEAIIIRSATKMTKELIEAGKNLKVIMRAGAGVDNVDVDYATTKKVLVLNCPGVNNQAVAELTMGFLYSLVRELPRATMGMKKNKWEKKELVGGELLGRTLGLVGAGAIGGLVAKYADAIGMKVIAYDPKGKNPVVPANAKWVNSMDEVFSLADMVSLHIPLLPATKHSIGQAQFSKMKKGSYFINCSRGGIVVEQDLLQALNDDTLAGAALDVFEKEPVPADDPLVMHAKVICAPHIGAATKESQTKIGIAAANHLVAFYTSGNKNTAVNG